MIRFAYIYIAVYYSSFHFTKLFTKPLTFLEYEAEKEEIDSPKIGKSGDQNKNKDKEKAIQDETIEEKSPQKAASNILSIMSRDGIRGPYGMDTSYAEEPQPNKNRKQTSQRYC